MELGKFTERIREKLPLWFSMKHEREESQGLKFLNVFGLQLDDIYNVMRYGFEQSRINSIDSEFSDVLYRAILPTNFNIESIKEIKGDNIVLNKIDDIYSFLNMKERYGTNYSSQYYDDGYYIDIENNIIYFNKGYGIKNLLHGEVSITYGNTTSTIETTIHHVWNFFDDLGALVGCIRLIGEKNEQFKDRILNVFKYPQNSTKAGIINALSNEIGFRETVIWTDPRVDYTIDRSMTLVDTIYINGIKLKNNEYKVVNEKVVINKNEKLEPNAEISYVSGIHIFALNDYDDVVLSNEIFNADGTATGKLRKYVEKSATTSSILWNYFKYDETMWSKNDDEFTNDYFGFIASNMDSNIKGFSDFGFVDTIIEYIT